MRAATTAQAGRTYRLVWLAIMLVTMPVFALRPPNGGGDQPTSEPPAALQPQQQDAEQASKPDTAPRQVKKPAAPASSADSFTPSERIEADSAVSFPVDI